MASYMIKKGFRNVKIIHGGGAEAEKYFEYYSEYYGGAKIINPLTGKVILIKK